MEGYSTPPPASSRRRHMPSSSLGSLYDVLADLDETQLQYLIQEMNHSGQNVPVSQAVSAFETGNPTKSLGEVRASMAPPRASPRSGGLQRQLSKSQQRGKLRLQTAFRRAPSLRQGTQHGGQTGHDIQAQAGPLQTPPKEPRYRDSHNHSLPEASSPMDNQSTDQRVPDQTLVRSGSPRTTNDEGALPRPSGGQRKAPAYQRIPRPDFDLPPGVTVLDLLNLLEAEFLSSKEESSPVTDPSSSPSFSRLSPSRSMLYPPTGLPSPTRSLGLGRMMRQPSRLDMALEAERTASGAAEIGLDMLEPRPLPAAAPVTPSVRKVSRKASAGPPVLEGIFDVLENR